MHAFKLTLAYDGTRYVGWQRQAAGVSIQALIEDAASAVEGRPVRVVGAGRTDAGVHALGQAASLAIERDITPADLRRALNARLPEDVRVLGTEQAEPGFNARHAALAKTYRYRILNRPVGDPLEHGRSWHVPRTLDETAMRDALSRLVGRRDFAGFRAVGSHVTTSVRTIHCARLTRGREHRDEHCDDMLVVEMTGDGFLRHMVRTIAGTLVDVGRGRRDASCVDEVLSTGRRELAGPTAPARGLFLVCVHFDPICP